MDKFSGLRAGSKLWFVPEYGGMSRYVTVKRVTKNVASLEGISGRLKVNTRTLKLCQDGYPPMGQCYKIKESYDAEYSVEKERNILWRSARAKVENEFTCPETVTTEDLKRAVKALDMDFQCDVTVISTGN